jgi:ribonuclease VapC
VIVVDASALLAIVENVTPRHAQIAIDAFATYGKGRRHKAGLNYGDCFVYALAKTMDLPLLFKGNDFSHTDLAPAL